MFYDTNRELRFLEIYFISIQANFDDTNFLGNFPLEIKRDYLKNPLL